MNAFWEHQEIIMSKQCRLGPPHFFFRRQSTCFSWQLAWYVNGQGMSIHFGTFGSNRVVPGEVELTARAVRPSHGPYRILSPIVQVSRPTSLGMEKDRRGDRVFSGSTSMQGASTRTERSDRTLRTGLLATLLGTRFATRNKCIANLVASSYY